MAQTDTKTFTVAEANRLLPLLRSIVGDVVAEYRRIREIERERRAIDVGAGPDPEARERARRLSDELKAEREERSIRIDGYIKEATDLGAEVKDLAKGLVDLPSLRGGRGIWLCWNLGDETISHWHGLSETADDRRPIDPPGKRASSASASTPPAPTPPTPSPDASSKGSAPKGRETHGGDAPA